MMEQIKREARSAAASVAHVAVDVVVRREEHQLYTKRTTILEQRVEPWSLDPFHPLVTRARQALSAAGCPVSCGKWQLRASAWAPPGACWSTSSTCRRSATAPAPRTPATCRTRPCPVARVSQAIYGTAAIAHSLVGIPVCGWTVDEI